MQPSSSPVSRCQQNVSFLGVGWDWVYLVRRPLFGLLCQPRMVDDGHCGAISGMRTGSKDRSTRRTPAPVPLYPPQVPHEWPVLKIRAAAVWSRPELLHGVRRPLTLRLGFWMSKDMFLHHVTKIISQGPKEKSDLAEVTRFKSLSNFSQCEVFRNC
jgi:hypothetical protein